MNPAIFQGVTFNNFGSGLIYDSKKIENYKMHFQTSFVLSYALCQYIVRLSATQKENALQPDLNLANGNNYGNNISAVSQLES